jgi:hypothetical protein
MEPGSTVEIERGPLEKQESGEEEHEVRITITGPPPGSKKPEPVGVGAQGEAAEGGGSEGRALPDRSGGDLPEDPEILPDVPDAPPADEPGPPTES